MTDAHLRPAPAIDVRPFTMASASAAEWDAYHTYLNARHDEDATDWPRSTDADRQRDLLQHWPSHESVYALARIGGDIVGSAVITRRRPGSTNYEAHAPFAQASVGVRKALRRRGVGTALARFVAEHMVDDAQTTISTKTHFPDGHAFLEKLGARVKQRECENRMQIDGLDWTALAGWERFATRAVPATTWEIHAPRLSIERFATWAPAITDLLNDQPRGTLETPPYNLDMEQLKAWHAYMDQTGDEQFIVTLMAGEQVAAYCEASWSPRWPQRAFQALTGVARSWRGQGLGKAVKARMLRLMCERHPEIAMITTQNANENAAMLAINRQLGFTMHKQYRTYQMSRDALVCALG